MRGLNNKNRRGHGPIAVTLIIVATLSASYSRAMVPTSHSGDQGRSRPQVGFHVLGLGTAALLQYVTRALWPTAPTILDGEGAAEPNFREDRIEQLRTLRAMPRMALRDFVAWGNAIAFDDARLIILDEDPFNPNDIERIMLLLRDFARAGDAIVVQSEGEHTITLENLYLMRLLVLEHLPTTYDNLDALLSRLERRERRRQLVQQFAPRLLGMQEALDQYPVIPHGVQLYTFAPFANLGAEPGEDGIQAQVAAQSVAVREALEEHPRVFLIRNRAFSPYFFSNYLRNHENDCLALEHRYHCHLDTVQDVINCETFWLFRLLGSLHRSLRQVTVVELFPKPSGSSH